MTSENIAKVIEAKNNGMQIVCRNVSASMYSWYITLVDPSNWNWSFNEYRIYQGIDEPPMVNEMNNYTVYFLGYTYYFIDNDGELKKVTNVNLTEEGAQYTSFLHCSDIQTDKISTNETDTVEVNGNVNVTGGLSVDNLSVGGHSVLTEDTSSLLPIILDAIYPVGSVYLSVNNISPSTFIGGTWKQISEGRVLQGASSSNPGGTTIDSGLPDITGTMPQLRIFGDISAKTPTGCFSSSLIQATTKKGTGSLTNNSLVDISLKASDSNNIYGNSDIVQPPAFFVYIWQRIS